MLTEPRFSRASSLADALARFMDLHGDARRGRANLIVDASTLYYLHLWQLSTATIALARTALLRPRDVHARQRASRAIFFAKNTGLLARFWAAIGPRARAYFKITVVFENAAAG